MEKILNKKEAAEFLRISVSYLEKLIRKREIPFIKLGKRTLFDFMDIYDWMQEKKVISPREMTDKQKKELFEIAERKKALKLGRSKKK